MLNNEIIEGVHLPPQKKSGSRPWPWVWEAKMGVEDQMRGEMKRPGNGEARGLMDRRDMDANVNRNDTDLVVLSKMAVRRLTAAIFNE